MSLLRLRELSDLAMPAQVQEAEKKSTDDFYAVLDFVNDSLADLTDALGKGGTLSKLTKGKAMDAITTALVAFKRDIESKLTDIEVDLMAGEADALKESISPLTEAKDYSDSGEFTDELFEVSNHIAKMKQLTRQPRWSNWMRVTDDNFSTSAVALNNDFVNALKAVDTSFVSLENELHSAE